jgi:hypothetical protein
MCTRYVSSICAGRVVQDRSKQRHNQWSGGPALLMERMEHTHYGRHFVDTVLDVFLLGNAIDKKMLSTINKIVDKSGNLTNVYRRNKG